MKEWDDFCYMKPWSWEEIVAAKYLVITYIL